MTDFADWADTHLAADWEGADDTTAWMDEYEFDMSDVEADADTLRGIGWGTDEDYGFSGDPWADGAFDFDYEPPF